MKIIGTDILDVAVRTHPEIKKRIDVWRALVKEAQWQTPHQMKRDFGTADILGDKQVIFNILGNRFRLLVKVDYQIKLVIVKKFGTHKEYDKWKL